MLYYFSSITGWIVSGNLWLTFWGMVPIFLAAFWLKRYLKKQKSEVLPANLSDKPVPIPVREDRIAEVGIDEMERLYIKPASFVLSAIYKAAGGVLWDSEEEYLFSPPPHNWTYIDWYVHMLKLAKTACQCALKLTEETKWVNIPDDLKAEMVKMTDTSEHF